MNYLVWQDTSNQFDILHVAYLVAANVCKVVMNCNMLARQLKITRKMSRDINTCTFFYIRIFPLCNITLWFRDWDVQKLYCLVTIKQLRKWIFPSSEWLCICIFTPFLHLQCMHFSLWSQQIQLSETRIVSDDINLYLVSLSDFLPPIVYAILVQCFNNFV